MEEWLDFFLLRQVNVRYVVLGSVLICLINGLVGVFAYVRRRALVSDSIAHSILPGIAISFLLFHSKNPLLLFVGAAISGFLSLLTTDFLRNRTKLKPDTAIGVSLGVYFGLGLLLLSIIQNSGIPGQAGLNKFLFGKAASILQEDLWAFLATGSLVLVCILLFFRGFKLVSFDRNFTRMLGFPALLLELLLAFITVLAIVTGIQAVGVVLMAAMLITPAATASLWTEKFVKLFLIAAIAAALAGYVGAFVSYTAPQMPTGPWIVLSISLVALFSLLLAPKKGLLPRLQRQKRHRQLMLKENLLKKLYHHYEETGQIRPQNTAHLEQHFPNQTQAIKKIIYLLKKQGHIENKGATWQLSQQGFEEGKRVTRLHRLWETYLSQRMNLPEDHVHDDAESLEHIITPEMEQTLLRELGTPKKDPHGKPIPY